MHELARFPEPRILILATTTCAYPGADATGQAHLCYPANTYIVNVPSPAVFPEQFAGRSRRHPPSRAIRSRSRWWERG